jgi:hypothetical protein
MQEWAAHGEAVRAFHYALFFELEGQRASRHAELCAALREPPACKIDVNGWFRLVNFKYSLTPLSPEGSLIWSGGRFNFGREIDPSRFEPFPALYLAKDYQTAFCEYHSLLPGAANAGGLSAQELALEKSGSWVTLKLKGHVSNVFDLTRPSSVSGFCKVISKFVLSRRVLDLEKKAAISGTTLIREPRGLIRALMGENWRGSAAHFDLPSNSQVLAKLLIDAGFEGVLYRSAKTKHKCLAVFTRQLVGSDTVIALHEDRPSGIEFCEINASNCRDV